MPLNVPGILVPLHLLINPRIVIPSLVVKGQPHLRFLYYHVDMNGFVQKDIRQLDFRELRKAGYRGAVFDKDNCLTIPHRDKLVPELKDAWRECRETFGEGNVLIVSNSAGTRLDPGAIQAESVSHHLSVPVLRHWSYKPSYSCIKAIRTYFASLPKPVQDHELIIVGDRIFTDVVLANRMSGRKIKEAERVGPLSVWTDGVWEKESMVVRALERKIMELARRWVNRSVPIPRPDPQSTSDFQRFVRDLPPPAVFEKPGLLSRLWGSLRGA